jgi:transposase InsO family protein
MAFNDQKDLLNELIKIHSRDGKFGSKFRSLLKASGIKPINTPHQAPQANALCERFIGSLQRECTDNFLIFSCLSTAQNHLNLR